MAKTKGMDIVGKWAFLAGVVLAVVLGALGPVNGTWAMVLVAIGLVVGLLNVADKEVMPFLMSFKTLSEPDSTPTETARHPAAFIFLMRSEETLSTLVAAPHWILFFLPISSSHSWSAHSISIVKTSSAK